MMDNKKTTILSGIAPSGNLQIGNYLGAIKQWVQMQDDYNCIFIIVDLHAITVKQDPKTLRQRIKEIAKIYLACGIDPKRSIIFIQSQVPAHTELAWILSSITKVAELERMIQYKEKAKKYKKNINAALMNYPILMAADILLYQTDMVPVGEDQIQHVEITRTIAQRFNKEFGEVFKIPKVKVSKEGARIRALLNPTRKMDKSDPNSKNYVALRDKSAIIEVKIKAAVTDSGKEIVFDEEKKPAISNLLTIYSQFSGREIKAIEKEYQGKGYGEFKSDLAEVIVAGLKPIQDKLEELDRNEKELDKILVSGAVEANKIAEKTLSGIKGKMGLRI